jgi:serine/threonine protein phosphatase PrpC
MGYQDIIAFSDRDIGQRERLEDYAADARLTTPGGLSLQLAMVADGVGGEIDGEKASKLAVETIINVFQTSAETNIPRLITDAIHLANQAILEQLRGMAKTTIALAVIDLNDGDFGRLYIGHVGDSRIYIVREDRLIRLNTDHTVANEMMMRGEIQPNQVPFIDRGTALTRALGIRPELQIDLGIYARRGADIVPPEFAHQQGLGGLALQEGDTVFASSDGLFDPIPGEEGETFLTEEEILQHALDNDVEKATRILMSYGNARNPRDNISLSMMFVPSPLRRDTIRSLSRGMVYATLAGSVGVVGLLLMIFGSVLTGVSADAEETRVAQQSTNAFLQTVIAFTDTPLPTFIPTNTATPRPTSTALPTQTPRPTIVPGGQIGVIFNVNQPIGAVLEDRLVANPNGLTSFVAVDAGGSIDRQANLFMDGVTAFTITDIEDDPGRQRIEMELVRDSNVFLELGDFAIGGVEIELEDSRDIVFSSRGACVAVRTELEQTSMSCYSSGTSDCTYQIPEGSGSIAPNQWASINMENAIMLDSGPISYSEALGYYQLIVSQNIDPPRCLTGTLDRDLDGFLDQENDTCPEQPGQVEGCPDSDRDGVPESRDVCPASFGEGADGCPLDSDNDTIIDRNDQCPLTFGAADNRGCPRDTDRDGVTDDVDECVSVPGDPNNRGCPIVIENNGSPN